MCVPLLAGASVHGVREHHRIRTLAPRRYVCAVQLLYALSPSNFVRQVYCNRMAIHDVDHHRPNMAVLVRVSFCVELYDGGTLPRTQTGSRWRRTGHCGRLFAPPSQAPWLASAAGWPSEHLLRRRNSEVTEYIQLSEKCTVYTQHCTCLSRSEHTLTAHCAYVHTLYSTAFVEDLQKRGSAIGLMDRVIAGKKIPLDECRLHAPQLSSVAAPLYTFEAAIRLRPSSSDGTPGRHTFPAWYIESAA